MAIGETILGAVLGVVFDRLTSPELINFFQRTKFDQSLVETLTTLMSAAQVLLLDAEEKQMTHPRVKEWLDELKHWFYRAEEVVDELATEALRSSLEERSPAESQSLVWSFIPNIGKSSSFENSVTSKIKEVIGMLENMLKQKDALGLRKLSVATGTSQRLPTTCLPESSTVYGRDQEKKIILEYLLSQNCERNKVGVLAIVGMGGLGKTTLAKLVYNDTAVTQSFDLKAWVCVSDQFDVFRVTKSILETISGQSCSGSPDLNFLQLKLSGELKGKRFLLVLDDVWNEQYEHLKNLQAPFYDAANGSKIIVTTRNEGVASAMRTAPVLRLNLLSEQDGWSLFKSHAFAAGCLVADPQQEKIGRAIVKKCKGLPLAIMTLGGLLRFEQDCNEWDKILQSSLWELPHDKSNIIPALWVSYFHLPAHLKRCFAYCALFPKGYKIDSKKLVLLWMAEGLLIDKEPRIEDVGDEYVRQLLSRSLLEPLDELHTTMHDLIHDLAQAVSGDFIATRELDKPLIVSDKARHFSYVANSYDGITKFPSIHEAKYLRTFLQLQNDSSAHHYRDECYLSNKVPARVIHQPYCLRVLSFPRYANLVVPESIRSLKQLRYLDMSCTGIRQLPESVSTLYHLQSLLLSDCNYLERLPVEMWRLCSLRHLDISGTTSLLQMPEKMRQLKSLETLTAFVVGKESGSDIKELGELLQVRGQLALRRLQNVSTPKHALDVNLSKKEYVYDLVLEFDAKEHDDSMREREVLENLKPHTNLKRLTICNYAGTTFPSWLDTGVYLKRMTKLCLTGCLYCQSLPPLGQLPSLKQLEIEGMDHLIRVKPEFYGSSSSLSEPFATLKSLSFRHMRRWEVWSKVDIRGSAVCFPCLRKLSLHDCPKLKGNVPVHLPSLEELEIKGCGELGGILPRVASIDWLEVPACPYAELASALNLTSIFTLNLEGLVQVVKLPPQLVRLSSLHTLSIKHCANLSSLANVQLPCKLVKLLIKVCESLESLPVCLGSLNHLRELHLISCRRLRRNTGDSLPTSLSSIRVEGCERWEFPIRMDRMQLYTSLRRLELEDVSLVLFPLGMFPKLSYLRLHCCHDLKEVYIPPGIAEPDSSLMTLNALVIVECRKLEIIGKVSARGERGAATVLPAFNLEYFNVLYCDNVMPVAIGSTQEEDTEDILLSTLAHVSIDTDWRDLSLRMRLPSLETLFLWCQLDEYFPDEASSSASAYLPASLKRLVIANFPNLREVDGRALQRLTALEQLSLWGCPKLECLPKEGLPPSLGYLEILKCPLLEERCERETGQDWSKIEHLPCVIINDVCISGS